MKPEDRRTLETTDGEGLWRRSHEAALKEMVLMGGDLDKVEKRHLRKRLVSKSGCGETWASLGQGGDHFHFIIPSVFLLGRY